VAEEENTLLLVQPVVKHRQGRPWKYLVLVNQADITVYLQDELLVQDNQYVESRQKEILGLLDKEVFKTVLRQDIPANTRIFNTRFVDEIKHKGTTNAFEKSRLVV
jgi:hypothetical protein